MQFANTCADFRVQAVDTLWALRRLGHVVAPAEEPRLGRAGLAENHLQGALRGACVASRKSSSCTENRANGMHAGGIFGCGQGLLSV